MLTIQHEEIINKLGDVRRACEAGSTLASSTQAAELAALIATHNKLEEDGLFNALMPDAEFAESLTKLKVEHGQINELVGKIVSRDISAIRELEIVLRNNISNEENGLFPACAVTLDGQVWDAIEQAQGI